MKSDHERALTRPYPHLVTRGSRQPVRSTIAVSNMPFGAGWVEQSYQFTGLGMLDAEGALTAAGRSVIDDAMSRAATGRNEDLCVVWGPDDCTWYDRDGAGRPGRTPPRATDTLNTLLHASLPMITETCWTFELPEGATASHLCIMKSGTRIEVAPGEPVMLAWFDDALPDGVDDPAAAFRDGDGALQAPARFRGQPVTAVEDGDTLLGPVQPSADGIFLRLPWPHQIREACRAIAGIDVAEDVVDRIFAIAHPRPDGINHVGVLKAA